MRATPPHVDVPGDNSAPILAGDEIAVRACIMARSGDLMGLTSTVALWRFGFTSGSEAARAYGVCLDDDAPGFLWVKATRKTGKVLATWRGYALDLPSDFRAVMAP